MGWVHIDPHAADRTDPSAGRQATRKDKGMGPFLVDNCKFDILSKRRGSDFLPHLWFLAGRAAADFDLSQKLDRLAVFFAQALFEQALVSPPPSPYRASPRRSRSSY